MCQDPTGYYPNLLISADLDGNIIGHDPPQAFLKPLQEPDPAVKDC